MSSPAHNTIWLRIELKTDVVVTRRSATVGVHECLDYLPGSVLLGAVAARLFATDGFGAEFFLSGKVRFGDGLPDNGNGGPAWPVPLNYHVAKGEKGEKGEDAPLINPLVAEPPKGVQRAQVRDRHLMASGRREGLKKRYQLKTAIARDEFGRASESQLFGYEALPAGQVFFAPLTFGEGVSETTREQAIKLLTGDGIRLGRSRSAQYGEVKIDPLPANSAPGWPAAASPSARPGKVALYLASDLALVNSSGAPTLIPEAEHFGLSHGSKYHGSESFIRSRRYSPWNAFRGARDTERQVFVRGSVLVFSIPTGIDLADLATRLQADGVGLHTAEGLGRVLVDPEFVFSPAGSHPKPQERKITPQNPSTGSKPSVPDDPLARCLSRRAEERGLSTAAEQISEVWTLECLKYRAGIFPSRSQWNEVREVTSAEGDWLTRLKAIFCLNNPNAPARSKVWNTKPKPDFDGPPLGQALWDECKHLEQQMKLELARAALRETAMRVVRTSKPDKS